MVEAVLRPLVPALGNIRPSAGFRGSLWSQFRSRFMKLMIWKKYRRQWIQAFRYRPKYLSLAIFCCKLVVRLFIQTNIQSVSQSDSQTVRRSVIHSFIHPFIHLFRQSVSQSVRHSVSPSVSQSVSESVSQWISHFQFIFYWFCIATFYLSVARFWRKKITHCDSTTETTWFKRWIFSCQESTARWQSKMELRT